MLLTRYNKADVSSTTNMHFSADHQPDVYRYVWGFNGDWNVSDRGHVLLWLIQRVHNHYTPGCSVDKTYLAAERNQLKHSSVGINMANKQGEQPEGSCWPRQSKQELNWTDPDTVNPPVLASSQHNDSDTEQQWHTTSTTATTEVTHNNNISDTQQPKWYTRTEVTHTNNRSDTQQQKWHTPTTEVTHTNNRSDTHQQQKWRDTHQQQKWHTPTTEVTHTNNRSDTQQQRCTHQQQRGKLTLYACLMPPLSAMFSPWVWMPFTCSQIASFNSSQIASQHVQTASITVHRSVNNCPQTASVTVHRQRQ